MHASFLFFLLPLVLRPVMMETEAERPPPPTMPAESTTDTSDSDETAPDEDELEGGLLGAPPLLPPWFE